MALALREIHPGHAMSERQLVAAVREGDDRAFELLFERYRRRISAYVYGLVRDHGRTEDITQEVFIAALRRLRATERSIAFRPWIYEIAKNACIDEFRRNRRVGTVSLEAQESGSGSAQPLLVDHTTPEDRWEHKQELDWVVNAITGLSDNHHRILVMREMEGLSYGEIATRMGMSRPMVESTLFRARRRLSHEYDELSSGRRCADVRATVDAHEGRPVAAIGVRQRRRMANHLSHCQPCLRYVREAGVDASALRTPTFGDKVAALLPFGWLVRWVRRLLVRVAPRHGGATASMAGDAAPVVAVGRGALALVALAVAGSALPSVGSIGQHTVPAPVPVAALGAPPAPSLPQAAAAGSEPRRVLPAFFLANLTQFRAAVVKASHGAAGHAGGAHGGPGARPGGAGSHHGAPGSSPTGRGSPAGGGSAAGSRGGAGGHSVVALVSSGVGAVADHTLGRLSSVRLPATGSVHGTGSTLGRALSGAGAGAGSGVSQTASAAIHQTGAAAGAVVSQTGQVAGAATSALTQAVPGS